MIRKLLGIYCEYKDFLTSLKLLNSTLNLLQVNTLSSTKKYEWEKS